MGNAQLGLEICWGQNSDKKEECEAQWVDPNQSVQIFLGKWSFQFKCSNRANNAEIPIVHYFLNFWWPRLGKYLGKLQYYGDLKYALMVVLWWFNGI